MKTDMDAIIKNVAVRNGAGLKKSDAVMQLVTVMDSIIESHTNQLAEHQKALLVSYAEKMEEALLRVTQDMNNSTKSSVNAVTEYAKGILPQIMTAGATEAVKAAKGELSTMLMEFSILLESFKHAIKVCGIAVMVSAGVATAAVLIAAMLLLR